MEHAKLILIFATVLKHGSMSAAAPHLGMSASAVSQHLRKLEAFYNMKLLNRSTRHLSPTAAGNLLWLHAQQLHDLMQKTDEAMQDLLIEPTGEVRITLPSGYTEIAPVKQMLHRLAEQFPKIRLTLIAEDKISDLAAENIDIALRTGEQAEQPDSVARFAACWQTHICASPRYLAEHPIHSTADLLHAHWLNHSDTILQNTLAFLGLPAELPPKRTNCPGTSFAARELALSDLGLTLILSGEAAPYLTDKRLQVVLPDLKLPARNLYLVTPHRVQSAKVNAVLGIMRECLAV